MEYSIEDVRTVKPKALEVFTSLALVAGIGIMSIGDGYGLRVNLWESPAYGVVLPDDIEGVPVVISIVGMVRKQVKETTD